MSNDTTEQIERLARLIHAGLAAETGAPEVLTVEELAALLRVERKTAYSLIQEGQIPGVRRIRGMIRIHRPTVIAWLASEEKTGSRPRR